MIPDQDVLDDIRMAYSDEIQPDVPRRMNLELLKLVRDAIADEDHETDFDMGWWFVSLYMAGSSCSLAQEHYGSCGTAACIAGHTVGQAKTMGMLCPTDIYTSVEVQARRFLNIDGVQAAHLFYGEWSVHETAVGREETVEYLDRCLAAGELVT